MITLEGLLNDVHPSFREFFDRKEVIDELEFIIAELNNLSVDYTISPSIENILRFASIDLNNRKAIVLGLDPYPELNKATGRAFEPGTLESFNAPYRQTSIKNILLCIHNTYNPLNVLTNYADLKEKMTANEFIEDRELFFNSLEQQGVLFLNTAFTYPINKIGNNDTTNNRKLWAKFTRMLLKFISETNPYLIWYLWGKKAQNFDEYIISGEVCKAPHPRMTSFIHTNIFGNTKDIINWLIL